MTGLTLVTFALKHIRHRAQQYTGFLLNNTFSFWLVYLFGMLLEQPAFESGNARLLLQAVALLATFASLLFLGQSHGAFLSSRQQELALLTVLGIRPRRIALALYVENAIVSLGGLLVGTILGIVFARFFVATIGLLIDLPLKVGLFFSMAAVMRAGLFFVASYAVITAQTWIFLRRPISGARVGGARALPHRPKRALAFTAMPCLAVGIGLALTVQTWRDMAWRALPVVGLLAAGAYLLFRESLPALMAWLSRSPSMRYRGITLVTLAQLRDKLRQWAGVLGLSSIITTIVIVALSITIGTVFAAFRGDTRGDQIGLQVIGEPGGIPPAEVDRLLDVYLQTPAAEAHVPVLLPQVDTSAGLFAPQAVVIAASDYNRWVTAMAVGEPVVANLDRALLIRRGGGTASPEEQQVTVRFGTESRQLMASLSPDLGLVFNDNPATQLILVVADQTFLAWQRSFGANFGQTLHGYSLPHWRDSAFVVDVIADRMQLEKPATGIADAVQPLSAMVRSAAASRSERSYILFLLIFVGVLFFLAAGNMLLLQLYSDVGAEKPRVAALRVAGMGEEAIRSVAGIKTTVVFMAPMAVGLLNALVVLAMYAHATAVHPSWGHILAVTIAYLAAHSYYCLLSRQAYVRALLGAPAAEAGPTGWVRSVPVVKTPQPTRSIPHEIAGLSGMMAGVLLFSTFMVGNLRPGTPEVVQRVGVGTAAVLFLVTLLVLAGTIRGRMAHLVIYLSICGAALAALGNLPPLYVYWDVWMIGFAVLGLGLIVLGVHALVQRSRLFPWRGLLPVLLGCCPFTLFVAEDRLGLLINMMVIGIFAGGWIYLGAHLWWHARVRAPKLANLKG